MKIESVAVAFPSRIVTTDEVAKEIWARSRSEFSGDLDQTINIISRKLKAGGLETRRWLGPSESSLELTLQACREAITGLPDDDREIDLLISSGVFSELIEPATANLIASKLGLNNVECFDLKEACDGWMKSAKVVEALMATGRYHRVLVVNGEFSLSHSRTVEKLFALSSPEQLAYRFPALTIGEAATATVFWVD